MKHFQTFSVRVSVTSRCYSSILFSLYQYSYVSMGKVYENTWTGQSAWFAFGVFNTRKEKHMSRETQHRPKSIANSESITEASKWIRSNWLYSICFNITKPRHRNLWNNEAWIQTALTFHSKQQHTPDQTTNQKIPAATLICGVGKFTNRTFK